MKLLRESWRGERQLFVVFWGYGIAFYIVLLCTAALLLYALPNFLEGPILIAAVIILIPYNIWIIVSIWRCAKNAKPLWRDLARFWLALSIVGLIIRILIALPQYEEYVVRQKLDQKIQLLRAAGFSEHEIDEWVRSMTKRSKTADPDQNRQH